MYPWADADPRRRHCPISVSFHAAAQTQGEVIGSNDAPGPTVRRARHSRAPCLSSQGRTWRLSGRWRTGSASSPGPKTTPCRPRAALYGRPTWPAWSCRPVGTCGKVDCEPRTCSVSGASGACRKAEPLCREHDLHTTLPGDLLQRRLLLRQFAVGLVKPVIQS